MNTNYQFQVRAVGGTDRFAVGINVVSVADDPSESSARALAQILNITVANYAATEPARPGLTSIDLSKWEAARPNLKPFPIQPIFSTPPTPSNLATYVNPS